VGDHRTERLIRVRIVLDIRSGTGVKRCEFPTFAGNDVNPSADNVKPKSVWTARAELLSVAKATVWAGFIVWISGYLPAPHDRCAAYLGGVLSIAILNWSRS
jgi:hypothetical protein